MTPASSRVPLDAAEVAQAAAVVRESAVGSTAARHISRSPPASTPPPARDRNCLRTFVPAPGLDRALAGDTPSEDGAKLLFATNSHTVMIRKTASDYRVLDKSDNSWYKLGRKTTAGLMFAKFSPDGTRAAYLADPEYNLYVEDIRTGSITQLTTGASDDIIDGASDWVNNEEFSLADCFLWSPDGKKIAYYQFDQSSVPEFALINYTDQLYPVITKYKYPARHPGFRSQASGYSTL